MFTRGIDIGDIFDEKWYNEMGDKKMYVYERY